MRSAIREGIRGAWRSPRAPVGSVRRGGIVDLALVVAVVLAMLGRTPVGGLTWYALEKIRGRDADLPTLTAYFSSGAAVAPVADVAALTPEEAPPAADDPDALPEPWRTAARASLSNGIPRALADAIEADGGAATSEAALHALDALWADHRDPEVVLEIAAIGVDPRARAVARATSAGEEGPERYAVHRRYLGGGAAREADRFVAGTLGLATVLDLGWPVSTPHRISSPFGDRMHPTLGRKKFHNGVDLSVPVGTPLEAVQDGVVTVVGESDASGRYLTIDHGNGVSTSYCHLDLARAPRGTEVDRGQIVALSGNTGRSTGPHLHYVLRIGGKAVDPERFRPE